MTKLLYMVCAMTFSLTSCNSSNPNVCSSVSPLDADKAVERVLANELAESPEQCVHRWAYRLASASGSNSEIAKAAVAACKEPIQYAAMPVDKSTPPDPVAYNEAVKEVKQNTLEHALFRVVQARAGNCRVE